MHSLSFLQIFCKKHIFFFSKVPSRKGINNTKTESNNLGLRLGLANFLFISKLHLHVS